MRVAYRALLMALLFTASTGCGSDPVDPGDPAGVGDPVVAVELPVEGQTVNRTFRVKVSCSGGCRRLQVYKTSASMSDHMVELATGTTSIDREVSLGGLTGELHIAVRADGDATSDYEEITVYAMNAPDVTEVVRTPGPVLDFDGTRALYGRSTPEGWQILLGNGNPTSDRLLRQGAGRPDQGVIVAPDLALFTLWRNAVGPSILGNYYDPRYPDTDSLFEWRSGSVTLLSPTSLTRRPPVEDGVAVWQEGIISTSTWSAPAQMPLRMRDLATGATTTLSDVSARLGIDIGPGPAIAWIDGGGAGSTASAEIVWWRNGAVTRISAPDTGYMNPLTDGTSLAFQTLRCCRFELQAPGGRQVLAEFSPASGQRWYDKYRVESGFVAWSRPEAERPTYEVLLRRPDGTTTTVASSIIAWEPPTIRLLTGSGALVYDDVLVRPGMAPRVLGSGGARVIERNGSYFLVYGNAVYRVN